MLQWMNEWINQSINNQSTMTFIKRGCNKCCSRRHTKCPWKQVSLKIRLKCSFQISVDVRRHGHKFHSVDAPTWIDQSQGRTWETHTVVHPSVTIYSCSVGQHNGWSIVVHDRSMIDEWVGLKFYSAIASQSGAALRDRMLNSNVPLLYFIIIIIIIIRCRRMRVICSGLSVSSATA